MKVLMLGWEFPPINSGGLGVASTSIAKHLAQNNSDIEIHFAIPTFIYRQLKDENKPQSYSLVELETLPNLTVCAISTSLHSPYVGVREYEDIFRNICHKNSQLESIYGKNLFAEIDRFAREVENYVKNKSYDIIHAHDWITFKAGIGAKKKTKAALVVHVHATEIDRTGGNPDPGIFAREKEGLARADHVITVSDYTKKILENEYRIPAEKITSVHNGVDNLDRTPAKFTKKDKIVLFLGRVTLQKGPDYFLEVAKKVISLDPNVKFIIGGKGDMLPQILSKIIEYGLQANVFCAGFLDQKQKDLAFSGAALYMMPSVSEPFGLSALEAVNANVPTLVCKQSGVSEVIRNSLKSDFWDVEKMANQVLAVLKYPAISSTMIPAARRELGRLTWRNQVEKIAHVYHHLLDDRI